MARSDIADAIVTAYHSAPPDNRTLHGFASRSAGARSFTGRDTAYALTLPASSIPIVVRHNRHGGALRALTGDLFLGATRAPVELSIALSLADLGVPTPAVLAYAVYPAAPGLSRSDVVTGEIPNSADLGETLLRTTSLSDERREVWGATTRLLRQLAASGVWHHDLNVKNVLLQRIPGGPLAAYLLDVDRVQLDRPQPDAFAANQARLRRSVVKWRRTRGAAITDDEVASVGGRYDERDDQTTSS